MKTALLFLFVHSLFHRPGIFPSRAGWVDTFYSVRSKTQGPVVSVWKWDARWLQTHRAWAQELHFLCLQQHYHETGTEENCQGAAQVCSRRTLALYGFTAFSAFIED